MADLKDAPVKFLEDPVELLVDPIKLLEEPINDPIRADPVGLLLNSGFEESLRNSVSSRNFVSASNALACSLKFLMVPTTQSSARAKLAPYFIQDRLELLPGNIRIRRNLPLPYRRLKPQPFRDLDRRVVVLARHCGKLKPMFAVFNFIIVSKRLSWPGRTTRP